METKQRCPKCGYANRCASCKALLGIEPDLNEEQEENTPENLEKTYGTK